MKKISQLILNKTLITFLLSILCLLPVYHKIIFQPNSYLFTNTSDGIKAYYVYAWHVKNDTSYHQFTGMNYPYGQTYIFTDGQPAIANAVKFIASIFPGISNYSIGIYNILLILSIPLCAILLLKIALRLGIKGYYAVFTAVAITIMSPQIYRLLGHLTLSYMCFFPLLWYLLIRYFESPNKKWLTILIITNGVFWGFVHPYFTFIQTLFLLSVYFFHFVFYQRTNLFKFKAWLQPVLQVVLPLILMKLYANWVDIHTNRTETPAGFYEYVATWKTVFLPSSEISYKPLEPILGPITTEWEGWAYPGFIAIIALLLTLLTLGYKLLQPSLKSTFITTTPVIFKYSFWPSVLLLVFAMGIPFIFSYRLNFILDFIPFIKQFRALGRFAWPFYFVAAMYGFYYFFNIYETLLNKGYKYAAYSLLSIVILFVCAELVIRELSCYNQFTLSTNVFTTNGFKKEYGNLLEIDNDKNYQAIIPLPFFHNGSENYNAYGTDESMRLSFGYSFHTGKPLVASSAARTPITEARNIMQLFAPTYFKKDMEGIDKTTNFLVLYTGEPLNDFDSAIWNSTTETDLHNKLKIGLYKPDFDYTQAANSEWKKWRADSLNKNTPLYFNTYENNQSQFVFEGSGAYTGTMNRYNVIAALDIKLDTSQYYTVSFWYYNNDDCINNNLFVVEECNNETNTCEWNYTLSLDVGRNILGNWTLQELTFKPKVSDKIKFLTKGPNGIKKPIYIDNLMLRKANETVYRTVKNKLGETTLYKNNYLIGTFTN